MTRGMVWWRERVTGCDAGSRCSVAALRHHPAASRHQHHQRSIALASSKYHLSAASDISVAINGVMAAAASMAKIDIGVAAGSGVK